ncbi:hypothetical protein G5V59_02425 [Nocardioides sp. W3-2-3]|uniref:N-acetylmuramoyl-L-alanine amidase n=1 Tax=Nocardioides convexus TaxID=2712224 RepID=UPI0024185922|nr:N-acetylmuramoyl-L-alanine amidase [Nocardioides convexus]NGZ99609.1 hypothetical protein [Nocardioides convexus]
MRLRRARPEDGRRPPQGRPPDPRAIVIHATVSPDNPGTAEKIAKWWAGPTSPVTSAHYVRDPNVTIQCVGDHTVAYHCGSNQDTIGYEPVRRADRPRVPLEGRRLPGHHPRRRPRRRAACASRTTSSRSAPPSPRLKAKGKHGIYGHDDSRRAFGRTTHTDPRDFPWDQFLTLVRQQIATIKKAAAGGPKYPKLAAADFAVWNAKVGDRPTFGAELEAVMSGRRFGAILETGGNRDVIREFAGDMKYSIYTGKGDVGASTMILAKHASGITRHGLIDVDTTWWGPKGKPIPGRAFPWFRWVEDGRPSMFIAPHMPWGPTRPRNVKAWVDCSKMLRDYAAVSTGYDLLIAGDLNQARQRPPAVLHPRHRDRDRRADHRHRRGLRLRPLAPRHPARAGRSEAPRPERPRHHQRRLRGGPPRRRLLDRSRSMSIVPARTSTAAKRGFIRTTAQAYAATLTTGLSASVVLGVVTGEVQTHPDARHGRRLAGLPAACRRRVVPLDPVVRHPRRLPARRRRRLGRRGAAHSREPGLRAHLRRRRWRRRRRADVEPVARAGTVRRPDGSTLVRNR